MRPWLNWIECLTTDQEVRGSTPLGRASKMNASSNLEAFIFLSLCVDND